MLMGADHLIALAVVASPDAPEREPEPAAPSGRSDMVAGVDLRLREAEDEPLPPRADDVRRGAAKAEGKWPAVIVASIARYYGLQALEPSVRGFLAILEKHCLLYTSPSPRD